MNTAIVKSIAIIGGGSAAWLTAAYLSKKDSNLSITVIDKEIGNPIGVGEATILGFRDFMKDCGFDFNDWFEHADATYKAGIFYPNWVSEGNSIWHPFFMNPTLEHGVDLCSAWSKNQHYDFKTYGLPLFDVTVNKNKIDSSIIDSYSFHVDCGKLVQYIQQRLSTRVKFIQSDVVEVHKEKNKVQNITLANGMNLHFDLYVDCTGFKSIIRGPGERISLKNRLFCDTAVAGPVQYVNRSKELVPYTRAEAVEHGWIWTTPTKSRIGSGLVFNRQLTSIEDAKECLANYWGADRVNKDNLRIIDWTPYYNPVPWDGNVVAIGLSAGFIEPLESTGLALILAQAVMLFNSVKDNTFSNYEVDRYNFEYASIFENCVDFVSMHYSKTNRTEPFWLFVKENYKETENIKIQKQLLKDSVRYATDKKPFHIFSGSNWTTWLIQLGYEVNTKFNLSQTDAEKIMLKYHNVVEKYRYNWSQDHESEINRMKELYNS